METDQGTYVAKTVILTPSVGVLQSDMIEFQPPLPQWKAEALDFIKMTNHVKIYAAWNEAWWTDEEFIPSDDERRTWVILMDEGEENDKWRLMGVMRSEVPMLMFTAIGDEGLRVESLSDKDIVTEIQQKLQRAYA